MKLPNVRASESLIPSLVGRQLAGFFDAQWYRTRYLDVAAAGMDPLRHFIEHGAAERRDPNRWFDSAWYAERYPDVGASGLNPLLHYLQAGAAELRNPHPRFDAAWYVAQHPEAAVNPLMYHLRVGMTQGWLTEKPIVISDYLPVDRPPPRAEISATVDIVIPVYRGLAETRRCIESVLADNDKPAGRIIVIDDCSPEPAVSAWLTAQSNAGAITLIRNARNRGFVGSVNAGIKAARRNDVVLLNSDTEVPPGWLRRLMAQAYAAPRIATVSPFSNNATICSYPRDAGGPIPFGYDLRTIDDACQRVNAGRSVTVPTTVGYCMYIRREALAAVGPFDEKAFGKGYGEENDFCLRASAKGWQNVLACDTFVYHEGSVSFGEGEATVLTKQGQDVLSQRYPHYRRQIAAHVSADTVGPFRFAVTAALFRQSTLPTILMVCHDLGGGVRRHVDELVQRLDGKAHCLLLTGTARGSAISVPSIPGHAVVTLPSERVEDIARVLRSADVSRVHIHHLVGVDMDVRALIQRLDVPFDVTLHDYYAICPQVNLLPWPEGSYCGEPGPAACNACLADRPSHGAKDILSWRGEFAWMFRNAARVLCPSEDSRARLARYGWADRTIVVPHEPVTSGPWPIAITPVQGEALRVAVLGVLANHKGAHVVASLAEHADRRRLTVHLIGHTEDGFPAEAARRIQMTGKYDDADLPGLIAKLRPHVIWFPSPWPETFSYTLSAAIESGLPIVATNLGAFPERLAGRPHTWLMPPTTDVQAWTAQFGRVRAALRPGVSGINATERPAATDYYARDYLTPSPRLVSPQRRRIVVIPERLENGALSPCAFIRLLQPLNHPAIGGDFDVVLADHETVLGEPADIIVTQRYAIPTEVAAERLAAHAKRLGATLLYDIDDDLTHLPRDHADADMLVPKTQVVRRMLKLAQVVWVSTDMLGQAVERPATVIANGLDERIWLHRPAQRQGRQDPLRVLCMGTATHSADFELIAPALARLHAEFGNRIAIDMLGFSAAQELPKWVNRLGMPALATKSYPGFVNWIVQQGQWDIGLAPLLDTPFNACKSSIKTLDYAALGLPVLASDVAAYRGSLADGPGGMLVANDAAAWYAALSRLLRDRLLRTSLADGARGALHAHGTLLAQAEARRRAWQGVMPIAKRSSARRKAGVALQAAE